MDFKNIKSRNSFILLLIIIIIGALIVFKSIINNKLEVNTLNQHWELNLSTPKIISHVQLDYNLLGESGNYTIYTYSKSKFNNIENLNIGELVNNNNIEKINNDISNFRQLAKDISPNYNKKIDLINAWPGDRYLKLIDSDDDRDYLILLIKPSSLEIHLLEVNM